MYRSRHRIFRNTDSRREHSRSKIAIIAFRSYDHFVIRQLQYIGHVWLQGFDSLLIFEQQEEHIALRFPVSERRNLSLDEHLNRLDLLHRICRKIEYEPFALFRHTKLAAAVREEFDLAFLKLKLIKYYVRCCQCRVSAEIYLDLWRKPADLISLAILNKKSCLGEVILSRNIEHRYIR